jgi:hypothetical protein
VVHAGSAFTELGEADLQSALFGAITDGTLQLVTDAGTELVVTAPSDIGLASSTARIARPPATGSLPDERDDESTSTAPPSEQASHDDRDVQVALSIVTSLSDGGKREAVYAMLQALARAVDAESVSHIQVSVRATLPESASIDIAQKAESAGASASSTPI